MKKDIPLGPVDFLGAILLIAVSTLLSMTGQIFYWLCVCPITSLMFLTAFSVFGMSRGVVFANSLARWLTTSCGSSIVVPLRSLTIVDLGVVFIVFQNGWDFFWNVVVVSLTF